MIKIISENIGNYYFNLDKFQLSIEKKQTINR